MKKTKILLTITTLLISTALLSAKTTLAADENLLPPEPFLIYTQEDAQPETGVAHLPNENLLNDILPAIIKILLGLAGSLALLGLTIGALMLVGSQGKEDQITKGKAIIIWTVIALVLISISYGIIFGVANLDLDKPLENP